ncbi:MAG: energy transducer TonB [Ignavibacteriaceae bacterium]
MEDKIKLLITILFWGVSITFAQNDTTKEITERHLICYVVEKMPEIIGGLDSLQINLQYPAESLNNKIEGKVYVLAFIDTIGNVSDVEIIKGIGYGCDEEALHVVRNAKFTPATTKGKKVKCPVSLPIIFKLPKQE